MKLLSEKYRPSNIDEFVFSNNEIREYVDEIIRKKDIPGILILSGLQGTGKTTLAKILINELGIDSSDVLTINASNENGIDNVRDKILGFAKTFPMGTFRVVVMEEADGLSTHAQLALRSLTETYSDTCRFIFTCNYPHKIIPALQSRSQHIHIDQLDMESVLERITMILVNEGIEIENPDYISQHVETFYPDMRRIINSIDQSSKTGTLKSILARTTETDSIVEQWELIWKQNPNRKKLEKLVFLVDENNIEKLIHIAYVNIDKLDDSLKDNAILALAECDRDCKTVAFLPLLMKSTLIKIFEGL